MISNYCFKLRWFNHNTCRFYEPRTDTRWQAGTYSCCAWRGFFWRQIPALKHILIRMKDFPMLQDRHQHGSTTHCRSWRLHVRENPSISATQISGILQLAWRKNRYIRSIEIEADGFAGRIPTILIDLMCFLIGTGPHPFSSKVGLND